MLIKHTIFLLNDIFIDIEDMSGLKNIVKKRCLEINSEILNGKNLISIRYNNINSEKMRHRNISINV